MSLKSIPTAAYRKIAPRFPALQRTYQRYKRFGRVGNSLSAARSDTLFAPVLGMHRSGTSATSNLLEANGLFLGDDLITANEHNPSGFYESGEAIELNAAVLRCFGSGYLDPSPLVNRFPTPLYRRAIRYLHALSRDHRVVGWKDPRTTVTWPCWQEVLADCSVRVIAVFRDPEAVARSLLKIYDNLSREDALQCWLTYNRRMIAASDNALFVNFDESLGPQIERVLPELGLEFDPATLERFDRSLVHNQADYQPTGVTEVDATYAWLQTVWRAQHSNVPSLA